MNKTPMKASDPNDLERHILDSTIAKTDAEWWAKRRIEELERTCKDHGEIQTALCKQLDALQADNARLRDAMTEAKANAMKEPE